MHKRGPMPSCGVCVCVYVCVSVCLSRSWIMSKRIKISLKFFRHRVAMHHSSFSVLNGIAIFRRKPPTGATPGIRKWGGTGKNWRDTLPSLPSLLSPSFLFLSLPLFPSPPLFFLPFPLPIPFPFPGGAPPPNTTKGSGVAL